MRTGALAQTQSYAYDAADRLTGVCFQAGSCPGAQDPFVRWSYDKVGNRLSEQRPAGTTSYGYDFRDRLLSAGATSYTYDENGNELSAGTRTFAYDLANRLKTTTASGTTTTYAYDGEGVRLQASTGAQANRKTNFLWDVSGGLPQIAQERDGAGALLRRYVYGVHRISQTAGNSTSYYLRDGLGSSANLTSSSGQTQWTWSYEPFGSIRTETKASGNQPETFMRFTGEYLDPTGLYHLRARQYDPAVGRFLRPDPVGQSPSDVAISVYPYVANRPTVLVDPSGDTFTPSDEAISTTDEAASVVDVGVSEALGKGAPHPTSIAKGFTCTLRTSHGVEIYSEGERVFRARVEGRCSLTALVSATLTVRKWDRESGRYRYYARKSAVGLVPYRLKATRILVWRTRCSDSRDRFKTVTTWSATSALFAIPPGSYVVGPDRCNPT